MPDGKFKATNIKILAGIEENMEDIRDTTVAEIKELKKQAEMKNTITMIWNWLHIKTTRTEESEEWIRDIEDRITENNEDEWKRERRMMNHEGRLRELSDSIKHNNILYHRHPRRRERKRGQKDY